MRSKLGRLFLFLHRSAGSIQGKFETICKKYFLASASEDSFLLFPLSSKLFHYFLCTINLLMDRIAGCKNTRRRKINFEFRGFLNFAKSVSGQISLHSFDKKSWLNDETFWLAWQKDNTVCQHDDDYLFSLTSLKSAAKKCQKAPGSSATTPFQQKSRNGDTLGPVKLIGWLEQGNQGDQVD